MARIVESKCSVCRREKIKLFLRGTRCDTLRCAMERRPTLPGQHGAKKKRSRLTDYGLHLREKQKLKRMYGISERQFKKYFNIAQMQTGNTGENLLVQMETRLDNILYSSGWTTSRSQARQMICHGKIFVNGKKVNIPSYNVRINDIVTPKNTENTKKLLKIWQDAAKREQTPAWLKVKNDVPQIDIIQLPKRSDIAVPINELLIVEFASR